ncbi:hypothetical protein [Brevundimonas sp.]|uniref:hypothetical protein n=1 Tax=Brevundimonas sp. TaxID=1871086 RepID=UPI001AC517E4|nr:hypothetical protein [Brevundimonas sp.]MBN9464761.1 hypothetical protein [Brevundimonas sp.]
MVTTSGSAGFENISGSVDSLEGDSLLGWAAIDAGSHHPPLIVEAFLDKKLIGTAVADQFRGDLPGKVAFRLQLDQLPSAPEFLAGNVVVKARLPDGEPAALPLNDILLEGVQQDYVLNSVLGFDKERYSRLLGEIFSRRPATDPFSERVPNVDGEEMSPCLMPVGHRSPGNLAVVGRQGHIFLLDGTNHLMSQYLAAESDPQIESLANEWVTCLTKRNKILKEKGIAFRQIIIPEKSTVLSDLYPINIDGPTAQFSLIEKKLARLKDGDFYIPVRKHLSKHEDRARIYSTVDTHFSPLGCYLTHKLIMASLGVTVGSVPFNRRVVGMGDVGSRFPAAHLCSVDYYPDLSHLEGDVVDPDRIELVESSRQIGMRIVYANPGAPVQKKVVAFANSFFELGLEANRISWWMSRWFSEFHFIWSPEIDFDYVEKVNPDIVIGQTIERFLVRSPRS